MSTNSFWMVQTWVPSAMSPRSRGVFRNMLSFASTKVWGGGGSSFWAALHISGSHTALFWELLTSPIWLVPLSSSVCPSTCLSLPYYQTERMEEEGSQLHPLSQKPWTQGMHATCSVPCTLPGLPDWVAISAPILYPPCLLPWQCINWTSHIDSWKCWWAHLWDWRQLPRLPTTLAGAHHHPAQGSTGWPANNEEGCGTV